MEKIFQVSEFNKFIDTYLRTVGEVAVEGEISRIDFSQNMWLFVTIKDKESTLSVFAVASQISGWRSLTEGMMVRIYGVPSLHPKSGRFSLVAKQIVPAGEGALRIAFEKLKERLSKEGLFDVDRKRALPKFPQKIGLVTAADKEAYNDFVKVLKMRMGGLKIYFYPVSVQGRNAVGSITRAITYFNENMPDLDLMVITRGGGSLEDLQAFNDEAVARAIFASKIPTVSGVGHERDVTLADLVADVRASTPSNAAELIVTEKQNMLSQINYSRRILIRQMENLLVNHKNRVASGVNGLKKGIERQVDIFKLLSNRFIYLIERKLMEVYSAKEKVSGQKLRLISSTNNWVVTWQKNINHLERILAGLDYKHVLKRGFSLTTTKTGKLILSVADITAGDSLVSVLYDGKIESQAINIVYEKE